VNQVSAPRQEHETADVVFQNVHRHRQELEAVAQVTLDLAGGTL
jgi:hypothetical protein